MTAAQGDLRLSEDDEVNFSTLFQCSRELRPCKVLEMFEESPSADQAHLIVNHLLTRYSRQTPRQLGLTRSRSSSEWGKTGAHPACSIHICPECWYRVCYDDGAAFHVLQGTRTSHNASADRRPLTLQYYYALWVAQVCLNFFALIWVPIAL